MIINTNSIIENEALLLQLKSLFMLWYKVKGPDIKYCQKNW